MIELEGRIGLHLEEALEHLKERLHEILHDGDAGEEGKSDGEGANLLALGLDALEEEQYHVTEALHKLLSQLHWEMRVQERQEVEAGALDGNELVYGYLTLYGRIVLQDAL